MDITATPSKYWTGFYMKLVIKGLIRILLDYTDFLNNKMQLHLIMNKREFDFGAYLQAFLDGYV